MLKFSYRCQTEDTPTECEPGMNNLVNEPDFCGDLQSVNGRFSECVKAIPIIARDYYRSCVMDMCSYEGEVQLLHQVKCSALESFVEECAENGINLKWRTDKFCRMYFFLESNELVWLTKIIIPQVLRPSINDSLQYYFSYYSS